jgi:hypothetical protein
MVELGGQKRVLIVDDYRYARDDLFPGWLRN